MAEELPLWEIGVGFGALHQPYYIGVKQQRSFAFPVPVPVYRGSFLKSDDEGVRAEVIESERVALDISMDFNFAIDSDDIDLRQGMEDIDNVFQIGPSVEIKLDRPVDNRWLLTFPLRAQVQFKFDQVRSAGYTFSPTLYRYFDLQYRDVKWTANMSLAIQFMSEGASAVFYGVKQRYATSERQPYESEGGYAGYRLQTVLRSRNDQRLWVFFARYDNIDGASFVDSPLVETRHGYSLGVIYSRFLFKSTQLVQ